MSTQTAVGAQDQPKSGLVWLASYPKSGNTWTRSFLTNLMALMAGETEAMDINSINRFSTGADFQPLFEEILGYRPTAAHRPEIAAARHRVQQNVADKYDGLIFTKTHNAMVVDRGHTVINFAVTSGAIYIVRNPLDVAISLAHHSNYSIDKAIETMAAEDIESPVTDKTVHEVWRSWSQHVDSWTRKPHPAIHVMRYEDMLDDPKKSFGALARHLRLDPTPKQFDQAVERSSFANLKDQEEKTGFVEKPEQARRFFREGRAGQWKDVLSPQQVERVVHDHRQQMARFGYLPK